MVAIARQVGIDGAGPGVIRFYWKVSSQLGDYVEFFIDGVRQARISGSTDWGGPVVHDHRGRHAHAETALHQERWTPGFPLSRE